MINKKHLLRTAISLMCVVTIASSGLPVMAKPSTKDLKNKTESLEGE